MVQEDAESEDALDRAEDKIEGPLDPKEDLEPNEEETESEDSENPSGPTMFGQPKKKKKSDLH